MSLVSRLYQGEVDYDFIGRRRRWYAVSGIVLVICIASMMFRGFQLGIDFKGGALFQFPQNGRTTTEVKTALNSVGIGTGDVVVQELSTTHELRTQTRELTDTQTQAAQNAIEQRFGVSARDVTVSTVGASWGASITKKAVQGLVVFLVLVVIYISLRFEWRMALSAIVALIHDLIITAGVYSLVGFEVTPSTVIALLTILGFSLYDTVVVFDKVRENTAGLTSTARKTYGEATNDAVNQTLMRSINTSLIALLPVASLLFIGAGLLGAGTLKDLALAQFVGLASGAYSSIFIASPLLVDLKEREPQYKALAARVARQRSAAVKETATSSAATGARSRARTALLERDDADQAVDADTDTDTGDDRRNGPANEQAASAAATTGSAARRTGTSGAGGPARSGRPTSSGRNPRKGGRPGRPSGKKRR